MRDDRVQANEEKRNDQSASTARGLVHVYTGDGKGKTTAALGLMFRATGKGLNVYMIQFMKGDIEYGEVAEARNHPNFTLVQFGRPDFVDKDNPAQIDIQYAEDALAHAETVVCDPDWDLVILDEINVALEWKLVPLERLLALIEKKRTATELVLTGRYAHPKIIARAHYVTEMVEVKHPFQQGVLARDGIEH